MREKWSVHELSRTIHKAENMDGMNGRESDRQTVTASNIVPTMGALNFRKDDRDVEHMVTRIIGMGSNRTQNKQEMVSCVVNQISRFYYTISKYLGWYLWSTFPNFVLSCLSMLALDIYDPPGG